MVKYMRLFAILAASMLLVFVTAACGAVATPVPNDATLTAEADSHGEVEETHGEEAADAEGDSVASAPTVAAPVDIITATTPPTQMPPTEAPTEAPATEIPTESPPTVAPTEAPTEVAPTEAAPADSVTAGVEVTPYEMTEADEQVVQLVQFFGDAANGEQLFQRQFDTAAGPWMCTQCHNIANEERLIGPGMLNLNDRAGERIPGMAAEFYVYNSIIHPNDYIVPDYPANVMPANYEELLSEQDLYDLSAYLLSLEG